MKRILFTLLLCLGITTACAQEPGVHFYKGSWDELVVKAKKEGKPYFIDFWASWCGPCKLMLKTTMADEGVGKFANANFIPFKLDSDSPDGRMLGGKYGIRSIPTIVFFSADGKETGRVGFLNPTEFMAAMEKYQGKSGKKTGSVKDEKDKSRASIQDYNDLKEPAIKELGDHLRAGDSLKKYTTMAYDYGRRKEDLMMEDMSFRLQKSPLAAQMWLIEVYYELGAEHYKRIIEIVQPKFKKGELSENELHWLAAIFMNAPGDEVPHEPMQWINQAVRTSPAPDVLDTKAALLFKDKKYDQALEVCKEARKPAKAQGKPDTMTEILEALIKEAASS